MVSVKPAVWSIPESLTVMLAMSAIWSAAR